MENEVEKRKRVLKMKETVEMTKAHYMAEISKSYRRGMVDGLLKAGKTIPEVAEILDIPLSSVRFIHSGL